MKVHPWTGFVELTSLVTCMRARDFQDVKMIYTASSCGEPCYLAELILIHIPTRSLRLSDDFLKLVEPRVHTSLAGRRFRRAGPKIWNWLPLGVRQKTSLPNFKAALSTFLFAKEILFYLLTYLLMYCFICVLLYLQILYL